MVSAEMCPSKVSGVCPTVSGVVPHGFGGVPYGFGGVPHGFGGVPHGFEGCPTDSGVSPRIRGGVRIRGPEKSRVKEYIIASIPTQNDLDQVATRSDSAFAYIGPC